MVIARNTSRAIKLFLPRGYCWSNFVRQQSVWSRENTVRSPFEDVQIPNTITAEYIWENLDKWPDKTAVICGVTKRSYTYQQLHKYSCNFAVQLRRQFGISDGDVVCIMMHNCPEFPIAMIGAMQAGAVITTVNPIYTPHEVSRQLLISKTKLVIANTDTEKTIRSAFDKMKKELPVIVVKETDENIPAKTAAFFELIQSDNLDYSILNQVKMKHEDVVILPYSSGTTGLPKGVELTNRNIVANCVQQDVDKMKHYKDTTKSHQDTVLAVLPFYHIYGLSVVMLHKISVGAKLVTLPKFHPSTFLNSLKEQQVTLLYAAPPIVLFLGSHSDVKEEHLENIDKIMCGAAPLHRSDIIKVLDRSKNKVNILQVYGLTETSPLATTMLPGSEKYSSAGFPLANTELRIMDTSSNNNLGPNKVGELLIKGPQVMKGYRDNPEATKDTFDGDWFKTGDLASIDDDGELHIADRLKELIKVKGYQVAPAELENIIKEHPHILDAGVIGIPDHRFGEVPKAFVVVKNGCKVNVKDIMNYVNDKVAEFKRIKEIVFLDSLPKNPSGKLLRRVLKDNYN